MQTLLLDKTGTITLGNRMASALYPVDGHSDEELTSAAQLASLADETPEGRSSVVLAKERFGLRARQLDPGHCSCRSPPRPACPGMTSATGRSARERPTRCAGGSPPRAARDRPSLTARSSGSPGRAPRRWRSPTAPACSA